MAPASLSVPQDLAEVISTANMAGFFLSAITYGVHLTLYVFLIRLYFDRSPYAIRLGRTSRSDRRTLTYATFLFLLATTGICLQTWLNHRAFANHRYFAGGPLTYLVDAAHDAGHLAIAAIYVILNWFADGLLLYRFFVLFGSTRYALTVCVATLTTLIITGSVFLPAIANLSTNLWTNTSIARSVSYLSLSLAVNVLLTFTIIFRLLYLRRRILNVIGDTESGRVYTSLAALFVESAALYTIIAFVCVVAAGLNSPVQNALLPMLGQLQAIPPLLIAIRVLECRVVTPETYRSTAMAFTAPSKPDSSVTTLPDDKWPDLTHPRQCLARPATITYEKTTSDPSSTVFDVGHGPCDGESQYRIRTPSGDQEWNEIYKFFPVTYHFTDSEPPTPVSLSSPPLLV